MKIVSLLSIETSLSTTCEDAAYIEGATPCKVMGHDCLTVPACKNPPALNNGMVENMPNEQEGTIYIVAAVVGQALKGLRNDVRVYDFSNNVKNVPPAKGVAYQLGLVKPS